MAGHNPVFGSDNGVPDSQVLFIAEAPGRLGAELSRIPLHGDQAGGNFEALLRVAGLTRDEIFVTNAVLCVPLKEGRNDRPRAQEVRNCSTHLAATLDLVQPRLVVTLGQRALDAINVLERHQVVLAEDVGQPSAWNHRILIPLFHPSQQVCNSGRRTFAQQQEDFRRLGAYIASM
jgi:DNA polymerase